MNWSHLSRQIVRPYTIPTFSDRLFLFFLAAIALWFYIKGKFKANLAIITLAVLIVFDLVGIGLRYVDEDDFVSKRKMTQPFPETALEP